MGSRSALVCSKILRGHRDRVHALAVLDSQPDLPSGNVLRKHEEDKEVNDSAGLHAILHQRRALIIIFLGKINTGDTEQFMEAGDFGRTDHELDAGIIGSQDG